MGEPRIPDFFLVGHHKSGTTALYEMLRQHPEIFMPDLKEPWFLASDMQRRFEQPWDYVRPKSLDEYLSLFASAASNQRVGEASATYLWSRTAAARIAELQPDARIVAIFREPAGFLRSLHQTFLRGRVESVHSFRRALALEGSRSAGRRIPRRSHLPQLLLYSEHVRYVEQLRRYHAQFPPEQVLVLIYDDFRADNLATVRSVLRLLEVDERLPIVATEANVTNRTIRSAEAAAVLDSVSKGSNPASRALKQTIKALTPADHRRRAFSKIRRVLVTAELPPPDERLMAELRRRCAPEVLALSDYLGRDLIALWGYDQL